MRCRRGGEARRAAVLGVPGDVPTIQGAIDAAVDRRHGARRAGDVRREHRLPRQGDHGHVRPRARGKTILDGGARQAVAFFLSGERRAATLSGFTIRNGLGTGVLIIDSSPTITGNVITGNVGCQGGGMVIRLSGAIVSGNRIVHNTDVGCGGEGLDGGGIDVEGSHVTITDNVIAYNANGLDGGGIALFGAHKGTRIERNVIHGNRAGRYGGGIAVLNRSEPFIADNVIYRNSAAMGGGIGAVLRVDAGPGRLFNNTIANNRGREQGSELYLDGAYHHGGVANNILFTSFGTSSLYCVAPIGSSFSSNVLHATNGATVQGACTSPVGIRGNVDFDPLFLDAGAADFRLQAVSPAIDAGDASRDP